MIKTSLALTLVLTSFVASVAQSKRVKQPREVIEAYQVCSAFRHSLAEDLDFSRAFEATFVTNPARRRQIAIAESEIEGVDLGQVDDATLIGLYKDQTQLLLLSLPLLVVDDVRKAELFPPKFETIFKQQQPKDPQQVRAFAAQLKRDLADFRAHVDHLAATNLSVAEAVREIKKNLSQQSDPPAHVVKPLTAYSKGRVLPLNARYYDIDNCAVIREAGRMKMIGFVFLEFRF